MAVNSIIVSWSTFVPAERSRVILNLLILKRRSHCQSAIPKGHSATSVLYIYITIHSNEFSSIFLANSSRMLGNG